MKDHALIGEFMGFWPTEQALRGWIVAKWKLKSHFDLQLSLKGVFTITFHYLDDKSKVEEGGPYFFNAAGLYLRNWMEKFIPKKEDLSWALVWIWMYSLLQEYWDEETLK